MAGDEHASSRVATPDAAVSGALDAVQKAVGKDRVLYVLSLTVALCTPVDRVEYFALERHPERAEILPAPVGAIGEGSARAVSFF